MSHLDAYFDEAAPTARQMIVLGIKRAATNGTVSLIAKINKNPVATMFCISGTLMSIWIISNATMVQTQRHPSPLFVIQTQHDKSAIQSVPALMPPATPAPTPKSRQPIELTPKKPQPKATAQLEFKNISRPIDYKSTEGVKLVKAVQTILAQKGFYKGKIDGKWGDNAASALRAYEILAGLPELGTPTPETLAGLQDEDSGLNTASIPVEMPVNERVESKIKSHGLTFKVPPQQSDPAPQPMPRQENLTPIAPTKKMALTTPHMPEQSIPELSNPWGASLTMAVEQRLRDMGYDTGKIDGKYTTSTQKAIELFERDHDMPITGRVNGRLLQEISAASGAPVL